MSNGKRKDRTMIDSTDLAAIDANYFDIIGTKDYLVVLRSRDTGHYWSLLEQEANGHRTFLISHKHNAADQFHSQKNKPSINACCEYIMDHDAFHLDRKRKQKESRLQRLAAQGQK